MPWDLTLRSCWQAGIVDANQFDGFVSTAAVRTGVPALGYAHASYERPNFFLRGFWNSFNSSGPVMLNPLLAPFLRSSDRNGNSEMMLQGHTYNIEAQHGIELGSATRVSCGINYRHNTLSLNFLDRFRTEDRLGINLQGEWKPLPILQVVGGARYDLDTFINPTISPRGSLILTPLPDHTIRATVAVGYRPPTMFETYVHTISTITLPPPNTSPPPICVLGSGKHEPEKMVSYDVEYQGWYLQHRLRIRASLFWNHISDLITHHRSPNVQTEGVADIYGGEAGMEFLATKWLSGYWNGAYQETAQSLTGVSQRGGPRYKWNAGLRGQWERGFSGEIGYHFVGAATYPLASAFSEFAPFGLVPPNPRVGSYHLLNLRGAYRFWQQPAEAGYLREAEVAVSAFNALNDTHKEHPLGDLIGSRVMGWLTVRY